MTFNSIQVAVVGSESVGKTSLISTFVLSRFVEDVPTLLEKQKISLSDLPENKDLLIVDTNLKDRESFDQKIKSSDIVCILYLAGDLDSLNSVLEFWLPLIQEYDQNLPICIVGTKEDLDHESSTVSTKPQIENELQSLLDQIHSKFEVLLTRFFFFILFFFFFFIFTFSFFFLLLESFFF
eukprot:Anaeramoba_flamelloidesc28468_g1_i2.p1 GENE.c28468_g1_i2~~c28468_g1_i2.p1  ORF type:complete len:181 (-),score=23.99 c28468_g1_i2:97-639(-)